MSFDVNPLGPQMHIRQLEREAEQQHRFNKIEDHTIRLGDNNNTAGKAWIGRLADWFRAPRPAS